VEIQTGSLNLSGGGTNSGGFDVAPGTILNLSAGTYSAEPGSSITGAGNLTVSGATANLAGLVNLTGSNTFSGGTANLTGNYTCANNTLVISGAATANFNGTGTVAPATLALLRVGNGNPTLSGNNTITVLSQMEWTGGTMSGSGRTIIPPGATLNLADPGSVTLSRTLENRGTALWTGAGSLGLNNGTFTNRAGALFHAQNAATISSSGSSRFDNAGTFRKSANAGVTTISASFNNAGAVEIQTGTLNLSGGGTNSGSFDVPLGAGITFSAGTYDAGPGSSIAGAGNLTVSGGTANLAGLVNLSGSNTVSGGTANLTGNFVCTNNALEISGAATANFNGTGTVAPANLALLRVGNGNPTLSGNNTVTVLGQMDWTGGTMSGGGRTIIQPGATLNLASANTVVLNRTLENGGTVLWTGAGGLTFNNSTFTNRAGALVHAQNAVAISFGGGTSRFDNAGTFRKSISSGTTTISSGVGFTNYGLVDIRSGILAVNGGYVSSSNALLNCALGGTTAGTNYGQLQVAGTVTLNGGLSVDFLPGFTPATNDTFTVLTASTRNGAFASFSYPSNLVTMQLSTSPNSVIVRTTGLAIPELVLFPPLITSSNVTLCWGAESAKIYRLEFSPDLGPTNWFAVPGEVITSSSKACISDALTTSNRFYRVRVLP
jgi:hypothetical protein